ncbi:MAG: TldD/PmbA family protein [Planctomycetes bacterium]|nr:TldD/PmbA family protein [Planctomycetota bacterium]
MPPLATEKLTRNADAYETFHSEGRSLRVMFENDRLTEIRQGENSGLAIRAVKHGKIGFSYSSKQDEVEAVAEAALRMTPFGKSYDFQFASPAKSPHVSVFDERCGKLDAEKLVLLCGAVKDAIKSIAPDATAECSLGGGIGRTRILTSTGQECVENESSYGWFVSAKISEEGNFLSTYRMRSGNRMIPDAEVLQGAREAAQEYLVARKPAPLKPGSYPVLFAPSAVSDLLLPIAVSINGLNIAKKTSPFVEGLGQKLFDQRLTILDDPFHEEGPSGGLYDGEGIVTQKRPIVENGVLKSFVHSLSTAKQAGHAPTGNAARSVSSLPMPGTHNVIMSPGTDDLDALYQRANGGLCIAQLIGTFTSNFLAGQVSGNVSLGYLVQDGRRVGRVKNCALNVNAFDVLKSRILGISKQREWVGSELLPWVLVDGVQISAR